MSSNNQLVPVINNELILICYCCIVDTSLKRIFKNVCNGLLGQTFLQCNQSGTSASGLSTRMPMVLFCIRCLQELLKMNVNHVHHILAKLLFISWGKASDYALSYINNYKGKKITINRNEHPS